MSAFAWAVLIACAWAVHPFGVPFPDPCSHLSVIEAPVADNVVMFVVPFASVLIGFTMILTFRNPLVNELFVLFPENKLCRMKSIIFINPRKLVCRINEI